MTQDQEDRPATRFQKVASALRGDRQHDPADTDPDGVAVTRPEGMASPPGEEAGPEDHSETMPDVFGTTARPDPGETSPAEPAGSAPQPAASAPQPAEADLRPGEATDAPGDFRDIAFGELIQDAAGFRQQWQQIQFKFVDDPRGSVTEAADIVAQVTARMEAAIQERQRIISERQRSLRGRWSEGGKADTETLRETLRMYRAFLDQLLGSTGSR